MLCWEGVVEMWGVLGQGCPPAWGLPTAWLSVGYLFIIYGVWSSPRTWRGQEDSAGAGGTQRVPPESHQHILALLVSQRGLARHSCGRWLWEQGWGWWPWDHVCVPSGDTEVARGASAGEHPTLSPGFPSSPCAAIQPFGSGSPSQATGAGGGGEGSPGVPLGRAGGALSLLLPFNKLVFL